MNPPIEAVRRFALRASVDAITAGEAALTIAAPDFSIASVEIMAEFDRAARALACAAEGIRRALKDAQSEAWSD